MARESTKQRLEALGAIGRQIDEAINDFTQEIKFIELKLARLRLAMEVTLEQPIKRGRSSGGGMDNDDQYDWTLSYRKHRNAWRIVILRRSLHDDESHGSMEDVAAKPLVEASRELRLAAVDYIDDLLQLIHTAAERKLNALKNKTERELLGQTESLAAPRAGHLPQSSKASQGAGSGRRKPRLPR
jgi:hypothetical protein